VRITSLYPTATEIAFAVGAGAEVVGVSHACDHPPEARARKVVTRPRFEPGELSSAEIYRQKVETHSKFGSIYRLDESALWGLRSDVLLSQGPAELSLISLPGVRAVAEGLNPRPHLLLLYPLHLDDVLDDHARVGFTVGHMDEARELVLGMRRRIEAVEQAVRGAQRRSAAFLQWLDPMLCGGLWIPQLVEIAGGRDVLNQAALSPYRIEFSALRRLNPRVIVIACEELSIERTRAEMPLLYGQEGWAELDAVFRGRVFLGSGAHFTRAGPRLIDALEALAWALHPNRFPEPPPDVLRPFRY
jgi:iron complex transport system substrate-binding protein